MKLIEGRKPNYYLSLGENENTDEKANNATNNKTFDKQYYMDLILKHIKTHQSATRKDIDNLLWNKLPEGMGDKQRKIRISNLIAELRLKEIIKNNGSDKEPVWVTNNASKLFVN